MLSPPRSGLKKGEMLAFCFGNLARQVVSRIFFNGMRFASGCGPGSSRVIVAL